ncbi:DUF7262 family protein [Haloplanus salilacus]|uniref:DUF7262 family protein n=1 Tax=Haloplanus salilacus TaxID=2949994 RepID=UPI0030CCECDA
MRRGRGQLSLSVVEAAVGVLLVVGVAAGFTVGVTPTPSAEPRLDALAHDTVTVLGSEPAAESDGARLVALARTQSSFEEVRGPTRDRIERLLPADTAFRVVTPHGAFGHPRPPGRVVGSATAPTRHGSVTVRVWYG